MEKRGKRPRKCNVPKQPIDIDNRDVSPDKLSDFEYPRKNNPICEDDDESMPSSKDSRKKDGSTFTKATTTSLVRKVFQNFFHGQIEVDNKNKLYPETKCGVCQACQLPDCGLCTSCKKMKKFGGTGKTKLCKKRRCENSLAYTKSIKNEQGKIIDDPVKPEDCSKQMLHSIKWIKKNSVKYNGNQGYTSVRIDGIIVSQGDFVMIHGEAENEPLRIAKVTYMYDSPEEGPVFHAHFFCRGTDTILGGTADPRELFVVDDCDDHALGCILQKTKVEFRNASKNWAYLGGRVNLPKRFEDNGTRYFFSKIYDYEFSKFKDYNEDIMEPNDSCFSCK